MNITDEIRKALTDRREPLPDGANLEAHPAAARRLFQDILIPFGPR